MNASSYLCISIFLILPHKHILWNLRRIISLWRRVHTLSGEGRQFKIIFASPLKRVFLLLKGVGLVRQRCRISYVTGVFNWYWLTVGQGLLSLHQVRVEGDCFYFFCFFSFIYFPFCPVPLFHFLYYLFYLSSPFFLEMTQNDPQGLTC